VALAAPTLAEVMRARERLRGLVAETAMIRIEAKPNVYVSLKLENLQPIGSFKLRGAMNKIFAAREAGADMRGGVYTASAGNMAQGVAAAASELGMQSTAFVPDTAPRAKTDAVERLGGKIVRVPYDEWWQIMQNGGRPGTPGLFIHPFADRDVMAGNGTIALEIIEREPSADTVLVPWGGGGLTCGIAATMRTAFANPRLNHVDVYACEVEGAAPLTASFAAGKAVQIENKKSFIDGIGGRGVFPDIWPIAKEFVKGSLVVTVQQVADALRLMAARGRVVAEGAGATPLAAAIHSKIEGTPRHIVCVVSGGNIDASVLAQILQGNTPS
jgi:threonine dehydratase